MERIFIGLGSNLSDPLLQLKKAIENLKKVKEIKLIQNSHFYRSPPMGNEEQPNYINAVVEVSTHLTAEKLLDKMQSIENDHGRTREQHWGARTLDLDLLLYGNEVINTERLTVPHYGLAERNFVLYPLADLVDGNFELPMLGKIRGLLAKCSIVGLTQIDDL